MVERWKTFRKKSPYAAGIFAGAVAALILVFLAALFFSAKGDFGSAKTILKEDYLRLSLGEFGQSGDIARARWRYERFGSEGSIYLYLLRNDPLTDPALLLNFARSVGDDVLITDGSKAAEAPGRNGFPLLGFVFVLLLLILAVGTGYLFLTDPKNQALTAPLRVRMDSILRKFRLITKKKTSEPAENPEASIRYRQPSFELHDYPSSNETEAPIGASTPVSGTDPVEREPGSAASIFDVFESDGANGSELDALSAVPQSPSADFFAEIKSQPKKELDPAAADIAFSDRDLPKFLDESRPEQAQDQAAPENDPISESDFEAAVSESDAVAEETEPQSVDRDHEAPPSDRSESAGRVSYAFYEPPRPRCRTSIDADEIPVATEAASDEFVPDSDDPDEIPSDQISSIEDDGSVPEDIPAEDILPPWEEADSSAEAAQVPEVLPNISAHVELFRAESIYDDAPPVPTNKGLDDDDTAPTAESDPAPSGSTVRFSVEPPRIRNLTYNDDNLPLVHYKAIYQLGDDLFDETFSIDDYDDEFIGECGIGIAETINTTEPKAVTAFEAWLFDRQDTTTPTFFMLSEYAYQQPEMLERLKNKGQYDVMKVGQSYIIETFALKMTLTILEIVYGTESSDSRSYFDRVVFDVEVVRQKA